MERKLYLYNIHVYICLETQNVIIVGNSPNCNMFVSREKKNGMKR